VCCNSALPLLEPKPTCRLHGLTSQFDPKRTSAALKDIAFEASRQLPAAALAQIQWADRVEGAYATT
jgi:hypothetical protein